MVITLAYADYFVGHLNRVGIFRVKAGDESVCFARLHHHHAEIVSLVHLIDSLLQGVALALHLFREYLGVAAASVGLVVISEVEDFDVAEFEVHLLCHAAYLVFIAEEHGVADAFRLGFHGCFEHRGVGALGKYHALGVHARRVVEVLGELGFLPHQFAQVLAVSLPVLDGLACHAAFHCGACHGHRNLRDEARVHGFRNEVVGAEGEVAHVVGAVHDVGHGTACEVGYGSGCRHLHFLVNRRGSRVERTSEDVGETDYVVDLVGIVCAPRAHQHVGAGLHGVLVGDLGHGVGEGEDNRVVGHGAHHLLGEHVAFREAYKHVRACHGLCQSVYVGARGGELALLLVEVLAVGGDDALGVEHHDVLVPGAECHVELRARNGGCARAVHHDACFLDFLARHVERVDQAGGGDNGRAVLVVVHHGDVELCFQAAFYFKTFRGFDVLEVNAAEGRRDGFHGGDKLLRIFFVHLDVEGIDAGIYLEKQALAFHHGLAAHRADVAEAEHGGAV